MNRCCHRDEYQMHSLCHMNSQTGRVVTLGQRRSDPCGNKCEIFRRETGVSINETATSRGQFRCAKDDGTEWEWGTDGQNGKDRVLVGFREYWHIRNLLSAWFPEIADLSRNIPIPVSRSPGFRRPGSSRGIVSRRFDEIAPENLLPSSYVQ